MEKMVQKSLAHAFIQRAKKSPDDLAVVLISADDQEKNISMGKLCSRAVHFSHSLRSHGIKSSDIVILALPHSFDLLAGFWGVQLIGAVSTIFSYKSPFLDDKGYFENIAAMVSQSGARAVLTIPDYEDALRDLLADAECVVLSTDEGGSLSLNHSQVYGTQDAG